MIQFILGLLTWTLVEYLIHRFVAHACGRRCEHHVHPRDYSVGPSWRQINIMLLLLGAVCWFFELVSAWMGFVVGFAAYAMIHCLLHHGAIEFFPRWLQALHKHHAIHHWHDDTKNYGVTSPLWDIVFRSRYVPHQGS